jgi:iron(III) transport system substrate-binding protein
MTTRVTAFARPFRAAAISAALLCLSACGSSESVTEASRSVTIYVSTDRVFSEPVLQEYQRRSGVTVNAVYDTEETKSTGLANRLLAERERAQAASTPAEERAAGRRADKAAYLREKLEERAEAEKEKLKEADERPEG